MSKISIDKDKCKSCLLCIETCPKRVIKISNKLNKKGLQPVFYIGKGCIGCAQCAIICPDVCIEVWE